MEKLDVIASFDWMDKEEKVGFLGHEYLRGSDVFSFEFDNTLLKRYPKIDFGCDLRPYTGVQYSQAIISSVASLILFLTDGVDG